MVWGGGGGGTKPGVTCSPANALTARTDASTEANTKFLTSFIVPGAGHVVFGAAGDQYLNQIEQFIREAMAKARS